jgi:ABC-2 type transport system ATP-binding protein
MTVATACRGPVESAIVVQGLHKLYQTYPAPSGESGGVFLWARQLRRALRLTAAPPRTVKALDGVNLVVHQGEILGLMGPNGAGKTTLVKIVCGLLEPTSGSVCVLGRDVVRHRSAARRAVSYVSTTGWMGLEWPLTVEENLRLYAALFGLRGRTANRAVAEALASVGLEADAKKHVYQLSSGMRQRTVLARGLLVCTPLLLLDEPTVGLDPVTARDLRQVVKHELNGRRGQTVLITSHDALELERLCDRVGVLLAGKLIALGTPAELKRIVSDRTVVQLQVTGLEPQTESRLRSTPGVLQLATTLHAAGAGRVRLHLAAGLALEHVLAVLRGGGTAVKRVATAAPTLEDAYLAYTGSELA